MSRVTLLVADGGSPSLAAALSADVRTVGSADAEDALDVRSPELVVVDATSVADPDRVVGAVRSQAPEAGVVCVGGDVPGDARTSANPDDEELSAAVERARQVAGYRESVGRLYDAARSRALGRPDRELREHRRAADVRFADLPKDEAALAAALRPDEGDEDG